MKGMFVAIDGNMQFATGLIRKSAYINSVSLAANVAKSSTVPAGAGKVVFGSTGLFFANIGATATVPGDVADGTASDCNPAGYVVTPGDVISFIATSACIITLSYYK